MTVWYNEWEPYPATWLRNLIAAGHLPEGEVDERDIREVQPVDLNGFRQCHFFAGIGGWPLALRLAGWPDDRPVWTASVPCQPLSGAGKRRGHADERHLWPALYGLVAECRPATILGEQVASSLGREWLAGVRADLEHLGYAVGAADLPAATVGAPHIRQRLFWVAYSKGAVGQGGRTIARRLSGGPANGRGLGIADGAGSLSREQAATALGYGGAAHATGSIDFWSRSAFIFCADWKWRRIPSDREQGVEPDLSVLAYGLPRTMADLRTRRGELATVAGLDRQSLDEAKRFRTGTIRAFGNAIVTPLAAEFVKAVMEIEG